MDEVMFFIFYFLRTYNGSCFGFFVTESWMLRMIQSERDLILLVVDICGHLKFN